MGVPVDHNFRHRKVAVGGRAVGQAPQVGSAPTVLQGDYIVECGVKTSVNFLKITFQYLTLDIMHLGVVSRRILIYRTQFSLTVPGTGYSTVPVPEAATGY